jgi:hypothetical protein
MNLLEKCREYIDQQHSVLWGEFYDIHDQHGKEQAAQWLAGVIKEILRSE